MKTLGKLLVVGALFVVGLGVFRYRSVDPCRALEREIVRDVTRETRAARDSVREALAGLGESTAEAADKIAAAAENMAVGLAQGAAKTKVENMTRRECVGELWDRAVGR